MARVTARPCQEMKRHRRLLHEATATAMRRNEEVKMNRDIPPDLVQLRKEIDAVDSELVAVLARRQKLVQRVVGIKLRDNLPAFIPARVDEVLDNVSRQATQAGLSPDLARILWTAMINWFVALEEEHLGKGSSAD